MKVRNIKFKFNPETTPIHYAKGNAFLTHMFNAEHIIFPEGEKFFIRSVRRFLPEIKDPQLKKDVQDFIGQEAVHYREHEAFWEVLKKQGLRPMPYVKFYNFTAFTVWEKWVLAFLPKRRRDNIKLAVTAALEHYTAMMATVGLAENFYIGKMFDGVHKEISYIFNWHAAEELEHKSVAFNVMKEVGVSNSTRKLGYILATMFLWTYLYSAMMYFYLMDRKKKWSRLPKELKEFYDTVFIQGALVKSKRPDIDVEVLWKDYFKDDFHPTDHNTDDLLSRFLEESKPWMEERIEDQLLSV